MSSSMVSSCIRLAHGIIHAEWFSNFIKEGKSGFDYASVSSSTKLVNANRLLVHALAYNLFNWFRRLALAVSMRKQRIDTIRLKLLKIAAKV